MSEAKDRALRALMVAVFVGPACLGCGWYAGHARGVEDGKREAGEFLKKTFSDVRAGVREQFERAREEARKKREEEGR